MVAMQAPPLSPSDIESIVARLYRATGATAFFDEPTVRYADAADPFFQTFKTVIGPFHRTPQEALERRFPGATARSVVSWVLPVREDIRRANRRQTDIPAEPWAAMRSFGEVANSNMKRQLCRVLQQKGWTATSPHEDQVDDGLDFAKCVDKGSFWSERHVAFVAGLGTFGLSGGLITEHGIAMRLGSVVTDLPLPATPRPYGDDPFGWCTRCGACARRCPGGSIGMTPEARDKTKCVRHIMDHVVPGREDTYGWMDLSLGCGLCQTDVPCEFHRP